VSPNPLPIHFSRPNQAVPETFRQSRLDPRGVTGLGFVEFFVGVADKPRGLASAHRATGRSIPLAGQGRDAIMVVDIPPNTGEAEPAEVCTARPLGAPENAASDLYILAHQDDELFFAPMIERSVRQGCHPQCIYTTDGGWHGVPAAVRMRETARALSCMGVLDSDIHQIGVEMGVRDGYSHLHVDELFDRITALTREIRVRAVYAQAWEGGNPDHDVAHLLGAALARRMGAAELSECPSHNAHHALPGLFRVMHCIPLAGAIDTKRLAFKQAVRCFRMTLRYPSQWRTFLGLGGPMFFRYVVQRRHQCRRVGFVDYTVPPHAGGLLYERRIGVSFDQFRDATGPFVAAHLGSRAVPAREPDGVMVA